MSAIVMFSVLGLLSSVSVAENRSVNGKADIAFEENTDPTRPVNPEAPDPTNPVTPGEEGDGEETKQSGPLSIDYLTNFKFGRKKMTGNTTSYYARNSSIKYEGGKAFPIQNFVQVTDNRTTGAGWTLTVQQDNPLTNGTTDIKQTELRLKNVTMMSENKTGIPTGSTLAKLSPGSGATLVTQAAKNQGYGTWAAVFGQDLLAGEKSVELQIDGGQRITKGAYSTTLTWTLADAPSN